MTTSNLHPVFERILAPFAACPIGRQPAADARLLADIAAADATVRPDPYDGVPADVAAQDRIVRAERKRGAVEPASDNLTDGADFCRWRTSLARAAMLEACKALVDRGMVAAAGVVESIMPPADALTCSCGEVMQYAPREAPDPSCNVPGHPPQWGCSGCGRTLDVDPTDTSNRARV